MEEAEEEEAEEEEELSSRTAPPSRAPRGANARCRAHVPQFQVPTGEAALRPCRPLAAAFLPPAPPPFLAAPFLAAPFLPLPFLPAPFFAAPNLAAPAPLPFFGGAPCDPPCDCFCGAAPALDPALPFDAAAVPLASLASPPLPPPPPPGVCVLLRGFAAAFLSACGVADAGEGVVSAVAAVDLVWSAAACVRALRVNLQMSRAMLCRHTQTHTHTLSLSHTHTHTHAHTHKHTRIHVSHIEDVTCNVV